MLTLVLISYQAVCKNINISSVPDLMQDSRYDWGCCSYPVGCQHHSHTVLSPCASHQPGFLLPPPCAPFAADTAARLVYKPWGVSVPAVAPCGGASTCWACPGGSITAGHWRGVACLETWGLSLGQSPGHGGGACSEGWDAPPIDLSGYCCVEGCF